MKHLLLTTMVLYYYTYDLRLSIPRIVLKRCLHCRDTVLGDVRYESYVSTLVTTVKYEKVSARECRNIVQPVVHWIRYSCEDTEGDHSERSKVRSASLIKTLSN
jgi:hypothetical protein